MKHCFKIYFRILVAYVPGYKLCSQGTNSAGLGRLKTGCLLEMNLNIDLE